jgi:DNA (cytosine-5)-methyltransferase 1
MNISRCKFISLDLFSGAGGLTQGLKRAGFYTKFAFEIDEVASKTYALNHKKTMVITKDIREVDLEEIKNLLQGVEIHLLAGCPPCQGFSSIRRRNKPRPVEDPRNDLIKEYVKFVEYFKPYTIMLENVPWLEKSPLFIYAKTEMENLGYNIDYAVVNVKDYGVPQNRKRLIMVGSRLAPISIALPIKKRTTLRKAIGYLSPPDFSNDMIHKIYPKHSKKVNDIISQIPHNGGSLEDLDKDKQLRCHEDENIGFHDVYGRLRWDAFSSTITGGCLNPSKGRFLHPDQDRCITAREAALLQTFPKNYKFSDEASKTAIALMIGNALPPRFTYYQAKNIKEHLTEYL